MDDLLLMYREKVGHVYAPREVKSAFENSFAICMDLKGKDLIRLQYKLFLKIIQYPIITGTALYIMKSILKPEFLELNR